MTPDISLENTQAQMRKGILEFCTLLVLARGEAYVSDILLTLKEANLLVVEGTLYPLLSRLRTGGLLSYEWRESKNGPPRKYYALTKKGKDSLKELTATWKELHSSINSLLSHA